MANRMTCYQDVDPIIIDCRCGELYTLHTIRTVESPDDDLSPIRFLQEHGRASFCPFCGKDYRTPVKK